MKIIATILLAACLIYPKAASADWTPPSKLDVVLQAVAIGTLTMDALQTANIKNSPLVYNYHGTMLTQERLETNALLGPRPSDLKIAAYFGGIAVASTVAWYYLPDPWRKLVPVGMALVEGIQVGRNFNVGLTMGF